MATKKVQRRSWPDEEKAKLIAEFEMVPRHGRNGFLKSHKISRGWFYKMRKGYFAKHPTAPSVKPEPVKTGRAKGIPNSSFIQRPDEEKWRLIQEYRAIPESRKDDREAWRERYGLSRAMASYWYTHLKKKAAAGKLAGPEIKPEMKSHPNRKVDNATEAAWVAEYSALPRSGGFKSAFLKAHNISHQVIFDMKKRVALRASQASTNGHGQQSPIFHQPEPATTQPPVTLDDAILSFEVQRDQLNTFIDQLKRMQRGGR